MQDFTCLTHGLWWFFQYSPCSPTFKSRYFFYFVTHTLARSKQCCSCLVAFCIHTRPEPWFLIWTTDHATVEMTAVVAFKLSITYVLIEEIKTKNRHVIFHPFQPLFKLFSSACSQTRLHCSFLSRAEEIHLMVSSVLGNLNNL